MNERSLARNLAHLIDAATPYRAHQRPLLQRESLTGAWLLLGAVLLFVGVAAYAYP